MTTETTAAAGSLRAALRHRGFGRFLTATIVSSAGDFLNIVGLVVLIYRATGSAAWLGAAAFCRVISWAAATAAGGVVADRYDRRKLLVGLNVAAGIVAFGLVAAARFDAAIVVVIGLSMMLDFTTGLVNPSFAAAVPAVVGEDDVAAANAAVTTVEQVSVVAGPALGAVLVAVFSPELAFFCNAITFLVAAALFRGVPAGDNVEAGDGPPARFRDGIAAVRSSRAASVLLAVFVAAVFSFGFAMVLFVLVAVRRLGMAESSVGYLRMAEGAGGVLAAVVAGRLAARSSSAVLIAVAVLTGVAPVMLALTTTPAIALLVLAVGGGAYVVLEVTVVTWLQRITPDEMLGRVMGLLMSLGAVGTAAGALLAPVLEKVIGLQWTLAVSGAALLAVIALVSPTLPVVARDSARRLSELVPFVDVLRSLGLFAAADELVLERLAAALVEVELGAGETVMSEGEVADTMYVVRSGTLDVHAAGEAGGAPRLVNTMGPDDWFGEIGLLQRAARTATVTTTTPVSLWRIPGDVFLAAFETASLRPDIVRTGIATRLARTHPSRLTEARAA
jgi:predicted MFS family arabinose efflux permease